MSGRRPRIVVALLAATCVLTILGWVAVDSLRDPLAGLDGASVAVELPTARAPTASADDRDPNEPTPGSQYVGTSVCAECHAGIFETYQSHPMSQSAAPAVATWAENASMVPSRFTVRGPAGTGFRFEYRATREDDEMIHQEALLDASGTQICSRAVPVQYAVGSGTRGRSYFLDLGGELYESPMTWYAGSRDWNLSPGYEASNEHFERRVLDDCVFCHFGRAAPQPGAAHQFQQQPIVEMGIGCERCHGPGEGHVVYHRAGPQSLTERDPIINPDRLSQPYRDDVCFQCHLQGLDRVAHPGRRSFDFRPGMAVADIWTVLLTGTKISDANSTNAVGQVEQMLASRCYIESREAMSCSSCHDPHVSPAAADRVEYYKSRCLNCHASGEGDECAVAREDRLIASAEDSCIQCHMPKLAANDVPHTSQTDHRVVRHIAQTPATGGDGDVVVYELDRIALELADRARGMLLVHLAENDHPLAAQAIPLLAPWTKMHSDDAEALATLGTAYFLIQDTRNALAMLDMSLGIEPDSEYALRQRMYFSHELGDLENGIRYGRRLIAINPHHYDYHGRMAHMLGQQGRWNDAIHSALQAADIRPWSPQIHGWLAEAYRITDQEELAARHAELYERLRSAADETRGN